MSRTFKVGARVRIIRAKYRQEMVGEICTVVSGLVTGNDYGTPYQGYMLDRKNHCNRDLIMPQDAIEPYYDGNEKVSWSECVWQPIQSRV